MKYPKLFLFLLLSSWAWAQQSTGTITVDWDLDGYDPGATVETCFPVEGKIKLKFEFDFDDYECADIEECEDVGEFNKTVFGDWDLMEGSTPLAGEGFILDQDAGSSSIIKTVNIDGPWNSNRTFSLKFTNLNIYSCEDACSYPDVTRTFKFKIAEEEPPFFNLSANLVQTFASSNAGTFTYECGEDPKIDPSNSECVAQFRTRIFNSDVNGTIGTSIHNPDWEFNYDNTPIQSIINYGTLATLVKGNYYMIRYEAKTGSASDDREFHIFLELKEITPSATSYTVCENESVTMSATASGSLTWKKDGVTVGTGNSFTISSASLTDDDTYTIVSSDPCEKDVTVTLTVNPEPVVVPDIEIFFCGSEMPFDFNNVVSVGPGNIQGTFSWPTSTGWSQSGDGTFDYYAGTSGPTNMYSHNATYILSFTSTEGCTSQSVDLDIEWNDNPAPNEVITDPTCSYTSDGSIVLTPDAATPNPAVSWSNNSISNSITSLSAGIYTVTITDDDACSTIEAFSVNSPIPVSVSITGTSNAPCSNGSVVNNLGSTSFLFYGGTSPYTVSIDGSAYFNPNGGVTTHTHSAMSGNHTYNVKDADGCFAFFGEPSIFAIGADVTFEFTTNYPEMTKAKCTGVNDGSIEIDLFTSGGTTPYSYLYERNTASFGPTNNSNHIFSGLGAGSSHMLTITEQTNNCQLVDGFIEVENDNPTPFNVNFSPVVNPGCTGVAGGQLTAVASTVASNPPFAWNTGATTQSITGLVDGGYTVIVTETAGSLSGCKVTESTTLTASNDAWHARTEATNSETGEKVIIDASNNVYVLGTFEGEATFGETNVDCEEANAQAFYVAKYNECGGLLWVSYPDMNPNNAAVDFTPIDLILVGSDVYVFLHTSTTYTSVDIMSTDGSASTGNIGNSTNEFTTVLELDAANGENTNEDYFTDFNFSSNDRIYDVEYDGSDFYLGGQEDDDACVHSYTFGNGSTTSEFENSVTTSTNSIHDIEFDASGKLYGVGTTLGNINLGGVTMTASPTEEGFVFYTNSSLLVQDIDPVLNEENTALALEIDPVTERLIIAGSTVNAAMDNMFVVGMKMDLEVQWTSQFDVPNSSASSADAVDVAIDADGRAVVIGSFTGTDIFITDNGSSLNVEGDNSGADLWIGGFNISTGQCDWLMAGESGQAITPASVASSDENSFVIGTYLDDIEFYQSVEPDHDHASNGTEAMFAIRFGTLYSNGNDAQFYKTDDIIASDAEGVEFNALPNPVRDRLMISWTPMEGTASLRIFDLSGRAVESRTLNAQNGMEYVDVNAMPSGTYILEMSVGGKVWHQKIVKD